MFKKLKLSNEHLAFSDVARLFEERKEALQLYCARFFFGCSENEMREHLAHHLQEAEYDASLTLLAAIEAAFRLDFDHRYEMKLKDQWSKKVRQMAKDVGTRPHRDIPIIQLIHLLEMVFVPKHIITLLIKYFKYRNWLAHGRYLCLEDLELGKNKPSKPPFLDIYQLAKTIEKSFTHNR